MNPRIQVEHTVTEQVTDLDLVIASCGSRPGDAAGDRPDPGRHSLRRRRPAVPHHHRGPGQRLPPRHGHDLRVPLARRPRRPPRRRHPAPGAEVSPHFDSLLVKLTCHGHDFPTRRPGAARDRRVPHPRRRDEPALPRRSSTTPTSARAGSRPFIDDRPELVHARPSADRGTRLLRLPRRDTVNRPHGPRVVVEPADKLPDRRPGRRRAAAGSRQRLAALGPEASRPSCGPAPPVAVTDTTFRDAHQSLLATRVRTRDLLAVAPYVARTAPELFAWSAGAARRTTWRCGSWPRTRGSASRRCARRCPTSARRCCCADATPSATRRTRPRSPTPSSPRRRRPGWTSSGSSTRSTTSGRCARRSTAVRATGTAVAEVALCYTGDLSDPGETLYTLDYYLRLAEQIVEAGAHVLAIKDMAGLLRPPAARPLVTALRERFDLPVHLHTHDTAGGQLATLIAAIDAGVDAVDAAVAPMAGTTSQPSLSALVAATDHTERATGLSLKAVGDLEPYWEAVRRLYAPFESGLPSPTGRVYHHEIPGGQLSNLRQQAIALGLGDQFELIEDCTPRPTGCWAAWSRSPRHQGRRRPGPAPGRRGRRPGRLRVRPGQFDVPDSVIGFLRGELGDPPGGWPEPFRTRALAGRRSSRARQPSPTTTGPTWRARPPRRAEPAAVPRPGRGVRRLAGRSTATSPCSPRRTTSTACAPARSTRCTLERGRPAADRARGHLRARRARLPHRDVHAERPATPRTGARRAVATDVKAAEKADRGRPARRGAVRRAS